MENALNNQVGMLGDMFLWLVANLKQGVIYFIKQGSGNHKIAWVYGAQYFKLMHSFTEYKCVLIDITYKQCHWYKGSFLTEYQFKNW